MNPKQTLNPFELSEKESARVERWADEHSINLNKGILEIAYAFCPMGSTVELSFHGSDGSQHTFLARDFLDPDNGRKVSSLNIGTQSLRLDFSPEAIEEFLQRAERDTIAHFEADCEPPGSEAIIRFDHGKRELVFACFKKLRVYTHKTGNIIQHNE
jgi:hypothetical protein